jgi:hypothetical protein
MLTLVTIYGCFLNSGAKVQKKKQNQTNSARFFFKKFPAQA